MEERSCNLAGCFLCRHCIPEWKEVIAVKKKTILVRKGKQLFQEGEKVKGIYFLYSGFAKIHQQWGEHKELILRFARSGDVIGHRGLGGDDTYPISATTLKDSTVCYIDNDFLEATLRTNHDFTYALLQLYASELQKAERRMRDLAHMEVKGRIAGALLEIAAFFGEDANGFVAIPLTRQDIASYAGTTYETIFKFFTELIQARVIQTDGKKIRILQPQSLQQFQN